MGRPCVSCQEHKPSVDRKLKAGDSSADVSRWLAEQGVIVSAQSVSRHAREHVGVQPKIGRRPISEDFYDAVIESARDTLDEKGASVKEGIAAMKAKDARAARTSDKEILSIWLGLSIRPVIAEVEAEEAEFRLLNPGE